MAGELTYHPVLSVPGSVSRVGVIFPANMNYEDWENLGNNMRGCRESLKFMIGDWINYGESSYGEKYAQAIAHTDFDFDWIRAIAWVCRKVPLNMRRERLTFSHHRAVAKLDSEEQDYWLCRAEAEKLSYRELVDLIKGNKTDDDEPEATALKPGQYRANVIIMSSHNCIVEAESVEDAEKKAMKAARKAIREDEFTVNLEAHTTQT